MPSAKDRCRLCEAHCGKMHHRLTPTGQRRWGRGPCLKMLLFKCAGGWTTRGRCSACVHDLRSVRLAVLQPEPDAT
eukprot:6188200-Pleurochrysis_carterae.AAC.1